jgi:glycosyltransferase involved in cell wall biosynthesis
MTQSNYSPVVSVVMPVYNQESYLSAAIESVLCQTFREFEFLIIDDGSTDGTKEILNRVKDSRVRLVSSPHLGFLKALQLGVREAKGKWVARMDSDDVSSPDRLKRQLDFLRDHPECLFVASVYGIVTPNDKYLGPQSDFVWKYLEPHDITLATELFADPSAVFDRQKAIEVGLYDPEFENEKPLWYKLLNIGRGAVLGEPLHFIRWMLGSHSRSEFHKRAAANRDIRLRYHPNGADLQSIYHFRNSKVAAIRAAARCVNLYILAGDFSAARKIAFDTWRRWPSSPNAWKIATKALLKQPRLKLWGEPDWRFVPINQRDNGGVSGDSFAYSGPMGSEGPDGFGTSPSTASGADN